MATTYKTALNRVLALLGEEQIDAGTSELTTTYQKILGALFNDVKEQIEDAHNWRALRSVETVTVTGGNLSQAFTNGTERSRVVRHFSADMYCDLPLVFDVTDVNEPHRLMEIDLAALIWRDQEDPDTRVTEPQYFAVDQTAAGGLELNIWPRCTGDRDIKVYLFTPQAYLDDDDLSTNITIPIRPLITGAVWYALEERGEELGIQGIYNRERFDDALKSAIARDSAESGDYFELAVR